MQVHSTTKFQQIRCDLFAIQNQKCMIVKIYAQGLNSNGAFHNNVHAISGGELCPTFGYCAKS